MSNPIMFKKYFDVIPIGNKPGLEQGKMLADSDVKQKAKGLKTWR